MRDLRKREGVATSSEKDLIDAFAAYRADHVSHGHRLMTADEYAAVAANPLYELARPVLYPGWVCLRDIPTAEGAAQ